MIRHDGPELTEDAVAVAYMDARKARQSITMLAVAPDCELSARRILESREVRRASNGEYVDAGPSGALFGVLQVHVDPALDEGSWEVR